jgi:hypothetical protein
VYIALANAASECRLVLQEDSIALRLLGYYQLIRAFACKLHLLVLCCSAMRLDVVRASFSCDPFFLSVQVTITCAHEHHSQFSPWVVKNCIWVCQHYRGLHTKEKMKCSFRHHQVPHYSFCIFDNVASMVFSF